MRSLEPPWMRNSLKILINDRDKAFSSKNREKFLRLRDEVLKLTMSLKNDYLSKAVASGNVKQLWHVISTLSKREQKFCNCDVPLQDLSDFFASTVQGFEECSASESFLDALSDVPLSLTCADVKTYLSKMKKSSAGPDGVPPWVLKNCCEDFAPFITLVFNRSLRESCVPSVLKHANIIPVPKCANAVQPCQFRPISIIPGLSRVLEKIV